MASRRRVRRAEERAALKAAMRRRCPRPCRKVRASTRAEAEALAAAVQAYQGVTEEFLRFYSCVFGGWHWTRMPNPPSTGEPSP